MDLLIAALKDAGFAPHKPKAGFFLYLNIPKSAKGRDGLRTTFSTAEAFSQWLITDRLISTVPWDDAGAYVRFSVTFEAHTPEDEKRVAAEIRDRLITASLEF